MSLKLKIISFLFFWSQYRHTRRKFNSHTEVCYLQVEGQTILVGNRSRHGGLFKLSLTNVLPDNRPEVNHMENVNLHLCHERLIHQKKRHIKQK